jgi:hypothetical protein
VPGITASWVVGDPGMQEDHGRGATGTGTPGLQEGAATADLELSAEVRELPGHVPSVGGA